MSRQHGTTSDHALQGAAGGMQLTGPQRAAVQHVAVSKFLQSSSPALYGRVAEQASDSGGSAEMLQPAPLQSFLSPSQAQRWWTSIGREPIANCGFGGPPDRKPPMAAESQASHGAPTLHHIKHATTDWMPDNCLAGKN